MLFMKKFDRINKWVLGAGIALLSAGLSFGQATKVDLDKPEISQIPSPDLAGGIAKKKFKPKDWLEVELKLKIEVPRQLKETMKYIDEVKVKWYIAVKNPEKGGAKYNLLEREVVHTNVPVDEVTYLSIYISPNTLKRLSGGQGVSPRLLEDVGGVITVNGIEPVKQSGYFSMKNKGRWWESAAFARSDKYPVLNKNETPFKNLWYDRYAEIRVEK